MAQYVIKAQNRVMPFEPMPGVSALVIMGYPEAVKDKRGGSYTCLTVNTVNPQSLKR